MPLEYGIVNGLSQVAPWDAAINDLRYNQQMKKQANALAEQQAKLFADDFAYKNAMNSFDNPKVKALAQLQTKKIGRFVNENPDWRTNVEKRAMYSNMIHDLKDNPDLNRGLISDKNYQDFQKDLSEKIKNPDLYDAEAYDNIKKQWDNYNRFGNQFANSEEEVEKLGGIKPFSYQAPRDFISTNKVLGEDGGNFGDFIVKPLKADGVQTGVGAHEYIPNDKSVNAVASERYLQNKRQMDIEAKRSGYANGFDYTKQKLLANIKVPKTDFGDFGVMEARAARYAKNISQGEPSSIWDKEMVGNDETHIPDMDKVLGVTPKFQIKSDDGKTIIDGTGKEVSYPSFQSYPDNNSKKSGIKNQLFKTRIPLKEAEDAGIVKDNATFSSDYEVSPQWRKSSKIINTIDKNGNDVKYVEYTDMLPFNVKSPTFKGKFEQAATINKYIDNPTHDNSTQVRIVKTSPDGTQSLGSDGHIYDTKSGNLIK